MHRLLEIRQKQIDAIVDGQQHRNGMAVPGNDHPLVLTNPMQDLADLVVQLSD